MGKEYVLIEREITHDGWRFTEVITAVETQNGFHIAATSISQFEKNFDVKKESDSKKKTTPKKK